jgi:hypothetical protein
MRRAMKLGASRRLRPISGGARSVLAILLFLVGVSTPVAAQNTLRLFTIRNGNRSELPAGTQLRIYVDTVPAGQSAGLDLSPDSVPPVGRQIHPDTIIARSETHNAYPGSAARERYLIIARLPGDTLLWSVKNTANNVPRYNTLDGNPIAMLPVPQERNEVGSIFRPRDSASHPCNCSTCKECPSERNPCKFPWGWIVLASVLSILGGGLAGWFARQRYGPGRSPRSTPYKAPDRGAAGTDGFYSGEAAAALRGSSGVAGFRKDVSDPQLEVLKSEICEHVTDQIKTQMGALLGELERRDCKRPPPVVAPVVAAPTVTLTVGNDDLYPGLGRTVDLEGPTTLSTEKESPLQRDVTAGAAQVFLSWCQSAGGNVSRVRDFAEVMQSRVAGSEVQVLARDRDNNAVTFVSGGAGDPIEYWMVTVPHASMLFPRPLNMQRFRELHPVYEGQAEPQSLRSIVPALVRPNGPNWVLERPGRVS